MVDQSLYADAHSDRRLLGRPLGSATSFRRVRDSAPAILFIDEIDAMGRIRGSRDDLRRATAVARKMVCEYGMSKVLGRRALGRPMSSEHLDDGRLEADYSGEVAAQIDKEIARLLDEGFDRAAEIITAHWVVFDQVVQLLVQHETLRELDLVPFAEHVAANPLERLPVT